MTTTINKPRSLPKQNLGQLETWFPTGSQVKYELITRVNGRLIRAGIRADGYRDQSWANVSVWANESGWQVLFTNPLSDFNISKRRTEWYDAKDAFLPEFRAIANTLIAQAIGLLEDI